MRQTGDRQLSRFQILALGLLLFAMFLGAGNIIFAPMVGQAAGNAMWEPMSGFLITGVGLVLLAIIALTSVRGDVFRLASRISPAFAAVFCFLLFLTLGPLYVIPRTTSVVHEITVKPNLPADIATSAWILPVFSVVFTAVSVYLSLSPGKLVDRIGKFLTPVFSALLVIIIVRSLVSPMGDLHDPVSPYDDGGFLLGLTEGYLTMDVLAALVFAGVFIQQIATLGVTSRRGTTSVFLKAGVITAVGLALLHISTAWLGGSGVDAIGRPDNGGTVLAESARTLLGTPGLAMIGTVVLLTGLTTNVACITSVADYFSRQFTWLSYHQWVLVHAGLGLVIANFGLQTVLDTALPILFLLYPLGMTLIVLALLDRFFGGRRPVYVGAVIGAGIVAVLDAVKTAGILTDQINDTFSFLPLFSDDAGWILPAVIGGIIGLLWARATNSPPLPVDRDADPDTDPAPDPSEREVATS
ncbi:Branched-chain amino acid transport system II carrier protein [Corynebacterium glyciniphilum AJ 3170]|uniref:Branched-chain amino acid transport system II carrier protein n=1 Tax=Corynebacterium glyciniphilum AJ 3170 TaxID=1404245 RepID=X5DTG2_9CORY|nr:branched-chain amino acid transport system II carrier protein [Corynebacterium glyciniphilum]AHW63952.1 Branched-chain amino acid transport system II carrier protein [Corynebacterium glyciniphilum AJ 3170]